MSGHSRACREALQCGSHSSRSAPSLTKGNAQRIIRVMPCDVSSSRRMAEEQTQFCRQYPVKSYGSAPPGPRNQQQAPLGRSNT